MKFILSLMLFFTTFSLFGKCEKIITSEKTPEWVNLQYKKIIKKNNNYYIDVVGKSNDLGNDEMTENNALDFSKSRNLSRILKDYLELLEDYTPNVMLKYNDRALWDKIKENLKPVICWRNSKTKVLYIMAELDLNAIKPVFNGKFKIYDEIIEKVNYVTKDWGEGIYPERKNLKQYPKPEWVDKKINIITENGKNYLYSVGVTTLYKGSYFSKSSADNAAKYNILGFLKIKFRISEKKSKGSTSSSANVMFKSGMSGYEITARWLDLKNGSGYSLLKLDIEKFNKSNKNMISDKLISMIKRNYTNKKPVVYKKVPEWIKDDDIKIVKIDNEDYYHIVGKSDNLGDYGMTIRESFNNAIRNFAFYITSSNDKIKDKNGELLPEYKISFSLNIFGAMTIDRWTDPKTKTVYTLVEINKELFEKYHK